MSHNDVYKVTEDDKIIIQQFYQKSEEEIKEYVEELKEWVKTQPHIPQHEDDILYHMILKLNKFKIEKAKRKLDLFYAIRNIVPDFYTDRSPKTDQIRHFMKYEVILTPLPRLFERQHRLYVAKFLNTQGSNSFDVLTLARVLFIIYDLRIHFDLATDEIFICDLQDMSLSHVFCLSPMVLTRMYNVLERGYSDRIKAIHFINVPSVAKIFIALVKYIMSFKIGNRIFTHKTLESLQKDISKEYLPSEFGGNLESLNVYQDKMCKFIENKDQWLVDQGNKRTKEELRPEQSKNPGMFTNLLQMFRKSKQSKEAKA